MYNITREMMHPQVRGIGTLIRYFLPYFRESTFRKINKVMVGSPVFRKTRGMAFEQVYIPRAEESAVGGRLRLCVYSPLERRDNMPGILWIHGGGYCIGIPEQDEGFIRRFVRRHNCVVVAPDYCLATKAPYPAALEDCYSALLWLKENSARYGINPSQLMVGGDSAGGGLTAALTIHARDKGEAAIAFQMPLYPMLDDRMITKSSQNNDAPVWNTKSNESAWRLYLRGLYKAPEVPAYAAPGRLADFSGLPPAATYIGTLDPFYDETVAYMESLKAAGIPAEYREFDGCYHAFDMMAGKSAPAKEAAAFLNERLEYAIGHYFAAQPTK